MTGPDAMLAHAAGRAYSRRMARSFDGGRIEVVQGDITRLDVDVIVNAANASLLGGGGVDGAIHRAAGPELLAECRTLGGARTGEAKLTNGYQLPARFVIHAVGPVWSGGAAGEDEALASCYRTALAIARDRALRTIAFPAISTGIYRFPLSRATRIAATEARRALAAGPVPERVLFCCFSADDRAVYEAVLGEGDGP